MREIRFRAWDGEQMYSVDELHFPQGGLRWYGPGVGRGWAKDCPVMQFTGLLDKNGKEIYERDIYLQDVWMFGKKEGTFAGVITYDTASFQSKYDWGMSVLRLTGEVIGNIYENPELVEQEVSKE